MSLYLPIFKALNDAGVEYVIVGGVATVLHGYARLTMDIDLILDLTPKPAAHAIETLQRLGFEPRIPVPATDFADPTKRAAWIEQKGMTVFSLHSQSNPMWSVDLFVENPIPFEDLRARSETQTIEGERVTVCSIEDLIALKSIAGRPQDLVDIEKLSRIQEKRGHGKG